jgi:hypothetical protein
VSTTDLPTNVGSNDQLGLAPERAEWERRTVQAAIDSVRLFNAQTLKERIRAAIEHAEAHGQMRDALWPHQRFALTLGELLRAAERGA